MFRMNAVLNKVKDSNTGDWSKTVTEWTLAWKIDFVWHLFYLYTIWWINSLKPSGAYIRQ